MCGIAGEVSFKEHADASQVSQLVAGIRHRGPDDQGLWVSPGGQCALGHARLSIIDLSPLGHQPMLDPFTGNSIVFNGEIYNFQSLRRECEAQGDVFRSQSDTEVILALYRRHGAEAVRRLRGMFAFVLWDERQQRALLARDRVGKKPLNYAVKDGRLHFCSELDPLARHPGVDHGTDLEALELYLQLQYVPAPWSIYRGIRKLPAAHYAWFDREGLRLHQYWEVDYRHKVEMTEEDALDGLEERLTEAVRLRMIADVPLGALLSGGVDSSIVVALMSKLSREPVRTFSMGFEEEAFNELEFAQQAATISKTRHTARIVKGDVEDLLPTLARHYGEPYADSSAVPSFFVCRTARDHVTVAMNGDGGDELLGGYPRYWLSSLQLGAARMTPPMLSPGRLSALAARLSTTTSVPGKVARKLLGEYGWPELRSVGMYNNFWNDAERAALMSGLSSPSLLPEWRTAWLDGAHRHADNPVDRMLWYDNRTYLAGDLLAKMDIAAMHCGLETRSPLLDHEVIEFCAALPVRYKVNRRIGKYLLKRLTERYYPAEFVHRPKMGFGIPLAAWLRGSLRPVLERTLRDPALMQPLDAGLIARTLEEFLNQGVDHSSRLWALLMFGVWAGKARR